MCREFSTHQVRFDFLSGGVHFRPASVCGKLPHPKHDMLRKNGLVRRYLLLQGGSLSQKRKQQGERERS